MTKRNNRSNGGCGAGSSRAKACAPRLGQFPSTFAKQQAHWAASQADFASGRRDEVRTYHRSAERIHRTLGILIERRASLERDLTATSSPNDRALMRLELEEIVSILAEFDRGVLPNALLNRMARGLDDRRLAVLAKMIEEWVLARIRESLPREQWSEHSFKDQVAEWHYRDGLLQVVGLVVGKEVDARSALVRALRHPEVARMAVGRATDNGSGPCKASQTAVAMLAGVSLSTVRAAARRAHKWMVYFPFSLSRRAGRQPEPAEHRPAGARR